MSDYLHGAYGQIQAVGSRVADDSQGTIVLIGTAPVQQLQLGTGESYPVNVPVKVNDIAEARKLLGYNKDWAKYSLCEAMHVFLEEKGIGPLVFINVLDPAKNAHKDSTKVTASLTPVNGVITIVSAGDVIVDSIVVKTTGDPATTKVKGTDYSVAYSIEKEKITLTELSSGALGSSALSVEYYKVLPSGVVAADVIGTTDDLGSNTGLYVMRDVYTATGLIPSFLAAPGWSSLPTVHAAMYANSVKVNGHWDAYMFVDLPLVDTESTQLTFATARTWKAANGYNKENETVFFPMAKGTDGCLYHLSVLAAANFLQLLMQQDGIPYKTASNTDCEIIENLYLGASYTDRVYSDQIINENLNKYGIASAAFVGGRWAIWGCHSADYNPTDADQINVAETNRMMLFYISNDFQHRRTFDVDKPMTVNDMRTIISEEQTRLDALLKIGALTYGEVHANASADARSDMMRGDFSFVFNVTTTPLSKSLTAIVNWTDEGFAIYFESAE